MLFTHAFHWIAFPFSNNSQFSGFPIFQARDFRLPMPSKIEGKQAVAWVTFEKTLFGDLCAHQYRSLENREESESQEKNDYEKLSTLLWSSFMCRMEESVAERHAIRKSLHKLNLNVDSVVTQILLKYFMCCRSFFLAIKAFLRTCCFICVSIAFTMCKYCEWKHNKLLIIL